MSATTAPSGPNRLACPAPVKVRADEHAARAGRPVHRERDGQTDEDGDSKREKRRRPLAARFERDRRAYILAGALRIAKSSQRAVASCYRRVKVAKVELERVALLTLAHPRATRPGQLQTWLSLSFSVSGASVVPAAVLPAPQTASSLVSVASLNVPLRSPASLTREGVRSRRSIVLEPGKTYSQNTSPAIQITNVSVRTTAFRRPRLPWRRS